MAELLVLVCLIIIHFCIKDDKNIKHKDTKEINKNNYKNNKKNSYSDENLHYEEVISDFLEHLEEHDGD